MAPRSYKSLAEDTTSSRTEASHRASNTNMSEDPYVYQQLTGQSKIRLIHFVPGSGNEIIISLRTIDLNSKPTFNALSYE
jgi:hypothetical protein